MRDERWKDPAASLINPRYIFLSLVAMLFIAAGVIGILAERIDLAELLGEYEDVLHVNRIEFVVVGVAVGLVNLVLTYRNRRDS